jgi:hypothetical protein
MTQVEMSAALLLGLLLSVAVALLFHANLDAVQRQRGDLRALASGRDALQRIGAALRAADYFGCASPEHHHAVTIAPQLWRLATDEPPPDRVYGQNDLAPNNPLGARPGSDLLILTGSEASRLRSAIPDVQPDGPGALLLVSDCQAARLARLERIEPTGLWLRPLEESINAAHRFGHDALLLHPFVRRFFVRESANGTPGLWQRDLDGRESLLASGIQDLQLLFGLDRDGDRQGDVYLDAAGIDRKAGWPRVIGVQLELTLGSPKGQRLSAQFALRNRLP